MQCIVVTPERTVRDTEAEFVALTLYDGEIGIAPGHAPMIGRLGYGEMRISQEERFEHYYVEGGFVEVLDDTITILTSRAVPAKELDEAVVREQLHSAQTRVAVGAEQLNTRERALSQGRAQLRVARRAQA